MLIFPHHPAIVVSLQDTKALVRARLADVVAQFKLTTALRTRSPELYQNVYLDFIVSPYDLDHPPTADPGTVCMTVWRVACMTVWRVACRDVWRACTRIL